MRIRRSELTDRSLIIPGHACHDRLNALVRRRLHSLVTGKPGRDDVKIASVTLDGDGRGAKLTIPDIQPVNQVYIQLKLKARDGEDFQEEIYWTINRVPGR